MPGVFGSYNRYGIVNAKGDYRFDRQVSFCLASDILTDEPCFVVNTQPGPTVHGDLPAGFDENPTGQMVGVQAAMRLL